MKLLNLIAPTAFLAMGLTFAQPMPLEQADWKPLHLAVLHYDLKRAKQLIDGGADVNEACKGEPLEFNEDADQHITPLLLASKKGEADMEELLLRSGANLEAKDWQHSTPLLLAVQQRKDDAALVLIKFGANVRAANGRGETPLHLVVSSVVAQALLAKGADPTANQAEGLDEPEIPATGLTPLHLARSLKIAELLVKAGAKVNALDSLKQSPLQQALFNEHEDIALFLIAHGANVTAGDKYSDTPLMVAAKNSLAKSVIVLVGKGAKVNEKNSENKTPLSLALENVTDPVTDNKINAQFASFTKAREPLKLVSFLLDHGANANMGTGERNAPPLVTAAMLGDDPPVIEALLKHGAKINAKDSLGLTALHWSSLNIHPNTVRVLLAHHAAVNARDKQGKSPLTLALAAPADAVGDVKGLIRMLKRAGGKP